MTSPLFNRLIQFVQTEFGVSNAEISTALHHHDSSMHLPMILWQYGFISLQQLGILFDWLIDARL